MWGSMFNVDDGANQPLADAYGIVMGSSHTEPMMRATNEWGNFGKSYGGNGEWAFNSNNASIENFFTYGAQRAKPYKNSSLFTMAMRGSGDTAIGLSDQQAIVVLENAIEAQRRILGEVFPDTSGMLKTSFAFLNYSSTGGGGNMLILCSKRDPSNVVFVQRSAGILRE